MKNILDLNYQIRCVSFDNNNNLYVASPTLVYLYNSSGFSVVSTTFNNIQAMTYDNGKIYLSDLVDNNGFPNLNIYSIIESTLNATLCNPDNIINPENFENRRYSYFIEKNKYPIKSVIDTLFIRLKNNEITVQNDLIYFINTNSLNRTVNYDFERYINNSIYQEISIAVCNIMGGDKRIIYDNNYNGYSIYGKILFYNLQQYLFGLSNIIFDRSYYDPSKRETITIYKRENVNKFMRIESDNTISEIDTQCYNFIFSTITTNGDIYIYEKDNTNYYINLYNNSGYQTTVYTNSVDLISGLISDNKGYTYAIKKNGLYSNIAILNKVIETPYEILSTNGDPSPCLKLIPNTYMYRSFLISNPLKMIFMFDAYLYSNSTAYFNFFIDASGSNGGCLCLSTNSSGSGVTTSTSLFIGNKTDINDYRIVPNEWHSYKITIDSSYNIIWYIDDAINAPPSWYSGSIVQLNTIKLEGINNNNNYCGFISNNDTLLIDNIFVVLS
jgi:hypothetical protein